MLLGSGKLAGLSALTGGTGVVGSMASPPRSKARPRFEGAAEPLEPDAREAKLQEEMARLQYVAPRL